MSTNSDGRVDGLSISSHNMSGSLPSDLGNLSEKDVLTIASSSLSGSIPQTKGDLSRLKVLILSGNNLSGSIPPTLGNLDGLLYLLLSDNSLCGCVPAALSGVTMDAHGLPFYAAATATDISRPTATPSPVPPANTAMRTETPAPTNTPYASSKVGAEINTGISSQSSCIASLCMD